MALAVRSPSAIGRFLTAEFYSEHVTLDMRMSVLRTVHAMADELGAPPPKPRAAADASGAVPPSATDGGATSISMIQGGGQPISNPIGRTRRWGTSSLRARPVAQVSLIGAVAPLIFYPLVARYDDPGADACTRVHMQSSRSSFAHGRRSPWVAPSVPITPVAHPIRHASTKLPWWRRQLWCGLALARRHGLPTVALCSPRFPLKSLTCHPQRLHAICYTRTAPSLPRCSRRLPRFYVPPPPTRAPACPCSAFDVHPTCPHATV